MKITHLKCHEYLPGPMSFKVDSRALIVNEATQWAMGKSTGSKPQHTAAHEICA